MHWRAPKAKIWEKLKLRQVVLATELTFSTGTYAVPEKLAQSLGR